MTNTFSHTAFDTELGPVTLAATDVGIIRISLPGSDPDELIEEIIARTRLKPVEGGDKVDAAADQIDDFLAGDRTGFNLDLDWRLVNGFNREALKATARIPYGDTRSYGEVAEMAGSPGAARAVGTAMSVNPIALIVPCHRVIKSDGTIGGYGGGKSGQRLKQRLLDIENPQGTLEA